MNMDREAGKGLPLVHRMRPFLEIQDLHVAYHSRAGRDVPALAGVTFEVQAGEILGVLGESGSGKSTLAAALLRLLPANGKIQKGAVRFEGQDLLPAKPPELEKIRGGRIAIIFQEPSMALHPTIRVGKQISDVVAAHEAIRGCALREKTLRVLTTVFPAEAQRVSESYPHQLSGGQRQRVLMAQAIACSPSLVIADEPTASLDPSTQEEILSLFRTLRQKLNLAMILITHNPAILAGLADRILVLYAGRVAEIGPTEEVLTLPRHPYTRALLECLPPRIEEELFHRKAKLTVIPGDSPNMARVVNGCQFGPRCIDRMDVCTAIEPAEVTFSDRHAVSCFKYGG
ncbi:MAG TPA: ABC transporter ATP-binding protein [Candidatus Acidoferrum sp.]|nr:ABC transporter ATP-binding protein [Candidatus Acidoferrum sp.]